MLETASQFYGLSMVIIQSKLGRISFKLPINQAIFFPVSNSPMVAMVISLVVGPLWNIWGTRQLGWWNFQLFLENKKSCSKPTTRSCIYNYVYIYIYNIKELQLYVCIDARPVTCMNARGDPMGSRAAMSSSVGSQETTLVTVAISDYQRKLGF